MIKLRYTEVRLLARGQNVVSFWRWWCFLRENRLGREEWVIPSKDIESSHARALKHENQHHWQRLLKCRRWGAAVHRFKVGPRICTSNTFPTYSPFPLHWSYEIHETLRGAVRTMTCPPEPNGSVRTLKVFDLHAFWRTVLRKATAEKGLNFQPEFTLWRCPSIPFSPTSLPAPSKLHTAHCGDVWRTADLR